MTANQGANRQARFIFVKKFGVLGVGGLAV
jgi:hypothetical protein